MNIWQWCNAWLFLMKMIEQVSSVERSTKQLQKKSGTKPGQSKNWSSMAPDLDPRRTAVFTTNYVPPKLRWFNRPKYVVRTFRWLMYLLGYGYKTIFVDITSEYGYLVALTLINLQTHGARFTLCEFYCGRPAYGIFTAYELNTQEFNALTCHHSTVIIEQQKHYFNRTLLPKYLLERMKRDLY